MGWKLERRSRNMEKVRFLLSEIERHYSGFSENSLKNPKQTKTPRRLFTLLSSQVRWSTIAISSFIVLHSVKTTAQGVRNCIVIDFFRLFSLVSRTTLFFCSEWKPFSFLEQCPQWRNRLIVSVCNLKRLDNEDLNLSINGTTTPITCISVGTQPISLDVDLHFDRNGQTSFLWRSMGVKIAL